MVKGACWEGELEGLLTTGVWLYFGGYLLDTYSSTADCGAVDYGERVHLDKRCC